MASSSLFLSLLPVLVAGISFQDELVARNPVDHIAIRNPQAGANGAAFCSGIAALFSACDAATPGIFSSAVTDIAGCLCYSNAVYKPSIFDDSIQTCADYASTALPFSDYSAASVFEGFCTSVGDYQGSPSPAASPTKPIAPVTTTPAPGVTTSPDPTPAATTSAGTGGGGSGGGGSVNIFTNSGCSYVSFALSFCNSASPGFSAMKPSSQAPCLCYSSTAWAPNLFDGAVKTCAEFVSTADPPSYPGITSIGGFCSSVGNVEAAATSGSGGSGGASAGGGGDTGGIGLTIAGGGGGGGIGAPTTPPPSRGATVTVANPSSASIPPAVTTIKNGDAVSAKGLMTNGAFRLAFSGFLLAFLF